MTPPNAPTNARLVGSIIAGVLALLTLAATAGLYFGTVGKKLADAGNEHLTSPIVQLNEPGEYLLWNSNGTGIDLGLIKVRWKTNGQSDQKVYRRLKSASGESELVEVKTHAPTAWISPIGTGKPAAAFTVDTPGEYVVFLNKGSFLTRGVAAPGLLRIVAGQIITFTLVAISVILAFLHFKKARKQFLN